ncbi:hypothetical protein ACVIGB_000648 [Bradyrhizobium sp. USDA 4341]
MTRKRTIKFDWTTYQSSAPAYANKWNVEFDDASGAARAVAMDSDTAPALISYHGRFWSRITRGSIPLAVKAADYAYRFACDMLSTVGFLVFEDDLYRLCERSPVIAITYNPYHGSLRLHYPELVKPHLIPSDPPEVYYRLDEYAAARALFGDFPQRVPVRVAYAEPERYTVLVPELLDDPTAMSLRAVLPMIVSALHRRFEVLPSHMIQDWLALRAGSSLQGERIDTDEVAALLGRLSRSGIALLESAPDRYGPNDWLRRASEYAVMLQLRLQPSGAVDEAIEMLSEALF